MTYYTIDRKDDWFTCPCGRLVVLPWMKGMDMICPCGIEYDSEGNVIPEKDTYDDEDWKEDD